MSTYTAPEEFAFSPADLDTPAALLATLNRMDAGKINEPYYGHKLHQAITNQDRFESDEWFDLGFEIGARPQLQEFAAKLADWHAKNNVDKRYLPDILANSFTTTSWVKQDLSAVGMVPQGYETPRADFETRRVEVSHSRLEM